jgi:hypothetical protein
VSLTAVDPQEALMPDDTTPPERGPADEPVDPATPRPRTTSDEVAAEEDLRATGDSIESDLRRLATVEGDKRALDAEDPLIDRLSEEAVQLADRIAHETRAERQLSEEIG